MPNTKSAKKALRQSKRRRTKNLKKISELKSAIKIYNKLLSKKSGTDAPKQISIVYKKLDKLAKTGVIKKGKADRLKSRLARRINKINS